MQYDLIKTLNKKRSVKNTKIPDFKDMIKNTEFIGGHLKMRGSINEIINRGF